MKNVFCPLPGKVLDINVEVGDQVKAGQQVFLLESMKMEMSVESEESGIVKEIRIEVGSIVKQKDVAIVLE